MTKAEIIEQVTRALERVPVQWETFLDAMTVEIRFTEGQEPSVFLNGFDRWPQRMTPKAAEVVEIDVVVKTTEKSIEEQMDDAMWAASAKDPSYLAEVEKLKRQRAEEPGQHAVVSQFVDSAWTDATWAKTPAQIADLKAREESVAPDHVVDS